MTKRPSVFDQGLAEAEAETKPASPEPRKQPEGTRQVAVYLPHASWRDLREIAYTSERRVNDVILDGLDLLLKQHGFPTTAERKASKQ
jgi:hypothetical protein